MSTLSQHIETTIHNAVDAKIIQKTDKSKECIVYPSAYIRNKKSELNLD